MQVVVMGVTGVGKTTVGRLIAERLGARFVDADDFHPPQNVAKMHAGIPLDDDDRQPWLAALNAHLKEAARRGEGVVLACSALKSAYRERLKEGVPGLRFVHLVGTRELIAERLRARSGHYMNPALLDSQFATLECPEDALTVDVGPTPQELANAVCADLARVQAAPSSSASVEAIVTGVRRPPLRTFFALWPGPEVRADLARRASLVAKVCSGRASRPDTLHLTLVFIGATPLERVAPLQNLMDGIRLPRFTLVLDQCGWFRHNGIAWAGTRAAPEPLIALQQALARGAEKLGFSLDVRPYAPHLTLARDASRAPPAAMTPALDWAVGSFVLVASELTPEGPRYRILHECILDEDLAVAATDHVFRNWNSTRDAIQKTWSDPYFPQPLATGVPMIDLHYWPTPNGHKITMFLEEAGIPYTIFPVNIGKGDQFKPDFLKLSPNNRIPAIVDHAPADGGEPISVFESGAILMYLAQKLRRFRPTTCADRSRSCSGCSGRSPDSVRWRDRIITLSATRTTRFPTPSTATSRKPIGCTAC